ncbi:50S ribosomal protein L27 [Candidatus Daviesbacteria bacterium RIFCSPHIGHO2_01_FULL_44_29]|uniref:Large ribosomal subunit protein bL27 n=1 Tax=Candidatus Daviesbacteria bacterium RIFCSPHIGHO2_02_FULL_43_12 TaxID=1797776 RepID=A0A1F5KK60_9BACT|nr:MAG: 50S ribosomal protein L27 [Candidatus Daviesbacteria bacterium RIFCSPHIGHO2_01_FULL_44_29]OGE40182.1 MAG: 50S ribosomal protein L27 [Candidatus Daviesbacteria bacterium RIFCSPHIGHO2_12_FULL_47_45]OGE41264.1 MAG: 50S ribosomal protein L27 [Candidatus Daviesbacteria bacterium RIFCSPHIGHO2_02_FULL_43_12]OGE69465.1 MAG: 50S ribosomal protein L27 [Candidatus Daviesbacteria bacterium RIFCSPLOWO2_01_FULL_43_15]
MSSKKGTGSVSGNKDSISKRLGVKRYAGEKVTIGNILVRQKGNKFYAGVGTKQGNDFTIFSMTEGKVEFKKKLGKKQICVV